MQVAVVNHKGGTGRTTTAVLLAAWLATHGRTVLIDLNFYPEAHAWSQRSGGFPFEVVTPDNGSIRALQRIATEATHLVLDTPSHDDARPNMALAMADVALVPTEPVPLDLWSLRHTSRMVNYSRQGRSPRTWVLLTMVWDAAAAPSARKAIEQDDLVGIPALEPSLSWKTEYAELSRKPNGEGRIPDLTEITEVGEALMSDFLGQPGFWT